MTKQTEMNTMKKRITGMACAVASLAMVSAETKPNILFIVGDDCGYNEFSFQGGRIPTPRIDSIAQGGVRCTQGYVSSAVCSPTRAGLLTGRYQQRFGHHGNLPFRKLEISGLPLSETLLPAALKPAGYRSIAVGKWHLGWAEQFRPCARGFDDFYGFLNGGRTYFPMEAPPYQTQLMLDHAAAGPEKFSYLTDELGERAASYIDGCKDQPFFLYLAFNATHSPQDAAPEDLAKSGGKKLAAMVLALDRAVGKVLDALDRNQLAQNTLVVFLSDNGGEQKHDNTPLRGFKRDVYEGGIRVPFLIRWPAGIPAGTTYDAPIIALDLFATALSVAGLTLPADKPMDGVNLIPYLTGETKQRPHQTLFWSFGDGWAVRDGDLKLVLNRKNKSDPELFDLDGDVSEKTNLAAERPADVARLKSLYETWKTTHKPSPWGGDADD